MFTKYSNVFLEVQRSMKNNQSVGNCLRFSLSKKEKLEDIDFLISQTVFETISTMERYDYLKETEPDI